MSPGILQFCREEGSFVVGVDLQRSHWMRQWHTGSMRLAYSISGEESDLSEIWRAFRGKI